jgi:hypothetical protein
MSDMAAADLGIPGASPDAAAAHTELEALKANPEWVKRHLSGDHTTKAEVEKLVERMHARPAGSVQVGAASLQEQRNEVADFLAETGPGLAPEHIQEIREGRANSPEIYRQAISLKRSLMADPAWVAKYMANDYEARRTMTLINIIESNPVALRS